MSSHTRICNRCLHSDETAKWSGPRLVPEDRHIAKYKKILHVPFKPCTCTIGCKCHCELTTEFWNKNKMVRKCNDCICGCENDKVNDKYESNYPWYKKYLCSSRRGSGNFMVYEHVACDMCIGDDAYLFDYYPDGYLVCDLK
jgi:hypothetical protein